MSLDFERRLTRNWNDPAAVRLDGYVAKGGYAGLRRAIAMDSGDVIQLVKDAGLRGRGGAGFPTGMKWSFVPQDTGKPTYVTVNFDESEPGTCNNRELGEREPHRLLEGTAIAARAIDCHVAFIYIRGEYLWQSIVLQRAFEEAYAGGYLGQGICGSDYDLDIVLHRGAGAYICGEETALLNSLEGLRGQPRLRPPFPAVEGLYASPTVINNVETLMNVPDIVVNGADWFRSLGTEKSPGTKMFTISGKVERPGNYEIPLGTPFRVLLEELGGGVLDGEALKAFTPGGSSTPLLTADSIDVHARLRVGRRGRVAAGHRRGDGDGRDRLRRGGGRAHGAVLRPRVLRQVHAVPRGHVVGHAACWAGSRTATAARRTSRSCTTWARTSCSARSAPWPTAPRPSSTPASSTSRTSTRRTSAWAAARTAHAEPAEEVAS